MVPLVSGPASPPVRPTTSSLVALNGNVQDLVSAGDVDFAQVGRVGGIGVIDHQYPAHAVLGAAAVGGGAGDVGDLIVDDRGAELIGLRIRVIVAGKEHSLELGGGRVAHVDGQDIAHLGFKHDPEE